MGVFTLKNKFLIFLLLALTIVLTLIACGDKNKREREEMTAEQKKNFSYIEEDDLGGYEFRILCRPGMIEDQYVEKQTGDIIADAVLTRNMAVESLLNVKITAIESSDSKAADALNVILAGDDQYDIILPHSRTAFNYAVQDALVNYNEVGTLNLDAEWWSQDIVDSANINNHLYVLDGDVQTHRLEYGFAMYFNKRIFDELGLDYPYQMALDGEWTFDEFARLVKLGSKDLNGDGLINQQHDQFGYATTEWHGPIEVLYTGGQRIYSKDARGLPKLTINSAKTVDIYSKFFDLCDTEAVFLQLENVRMPDKDLFTDGRAMFADRGLSSAKSMRSMADDFGILPWPKFTAEDEYATAVNGHASLLIVPVTVEDPDTTGQVIEALCAVGHHEVIPAFYEVSLKTKFARDAESEAMIDIIKDSLIYDLGYVSGGAFQSTGMQLSSLSNPDFASFYAANESKAITDLNQFLKSYGKVA